MINAKMRTAIQSVQVMGSSDVENCSSKSATEGASQLTSPPTSNSHHEKKQETSWRTSILSKGTPRHQFISLTCIVVLASHFVVMNTSGFTNSFGALQSHFIDTYNEPSSTVSWVGSMQIFLYFFIGVFSGRLTDAGYFRVTFLAGSLASVVGIFAASFGSELWVMFLTLDLGVGLGNGLMSCPMFAVMSPYFSARRGLAIGITTCGSCTGGLVYSAIMRQLIPTLGFPWTMRVIALIQLVTLGMANVCLRPRTKVQKATSWVDWTAFEDFRFNYYTVSVFLVSANMSPACVRLLTGIFLVLAGSVYLYLLRRRLFAIIYLTAILIPEVNGPSFNI